MRYINRIFSLLILALLPSLCAKTATETKLIIKLTSGDDESFGLSESPAIRFTNDKLLIERLSFSKSLNEVVGMTFVPEQVSEAGQSIDFDVKQIPVAQAVSYELPASELTPVNKPFPATLSNATVVFAQNSYSYTGSAVIPSYVVQFGDVILVEGTDYVATYSDNTTPGTATVTITGKGSYTGYLSATYTITVTQTVTVSIDGDTIAAENVKTLTDGTTRAFFETNNGLVSVSDIYATAGSTLAIIVRPKNGMLLSKDDIKPELDGADPSDLSATREYSYVMPDSGFVHMSFVFRDKPVSEDIASASVTLAANEYTYSGTAFEPSVSVVYNGTVLTAGTDYTLSYQNNQNVGTGIVTVTGQGNYTGSLSADFVINKAKLTVTADSVQRAYGEANPQLTYSIEGFVNGETADSLTTQPKATTVAKAESPLGQYDITVAGGASLNYEFEYVPAKLTVVAADISSADIAITATEPFVYTGDSIMPAFTARLGTTLLTADTDFKAVFTDNVKAGEAVLTLTGQGNYEGTVTTTFTIGKAMLTVTAQDSSMVYGDALPEPTYEVTGFVGDEDASVLTAAPVVSTEATSASGVGKYAITATGGEAANYDFTYVDGVLTVGPRSIDDATLTLAADSVAYTGKALEPELTIVLGTVELTAGTDYYVEYRNNTETGTASVIVTGQGNYEDSKTASFTVYLRPALAVTINGETIKPEVEELLKNSAPATFRAEQGTINVDNYYAMPGSIVMLTVTPNKEKYYYITREDIEGIDLIGSEPEDSSAVRSYRFIVPESGTVDLKATFTYDEVAAGIRDSYVTDLRFEVVDGGKAVRVTGADEGAPVSVFDARGQQVAADVVRSVRELTVRLSHQPQGLYIIKVNNKSFKVYRK